MPQIVLKVRGSVGRLKRRSQEWLEGDGEVLRRRVGVVEDVVVRSGMGCSRRWLWGGSGETVL